MGIPLGMSYFQQKVENVFNATCASEFVSNTGDGAIFGSCSIFFTENL